MTNVKRKPGRVTFFQFENLRRQQTAEFVGWINNNGEMEEIEFISTRNGGFPITEFVLTLEEFTQLLTNWKETNFEAPQPVKFTSEHDVITILLQPSATAILVMAVEISDKYNYDAKLTPWKLKLMADQLKLDEALTLLQETK